MQAPGTFAEQIFAIIKEHGPISTQAIAKLIGKSKDATDHYIRMLSTPGKKRIYVALINKTQGSGKQGRMWAVGDFEDAQIVRSPKGRMSFEERERREDMRVRREALAKNVIHRHWQDVALFGAAL